MSDPIDWDAEVIPRCRHGAIILGCENDDCPEQNIYLAAQARTMSAWEAWQLAEARRIVRNELGLSDE
jgi:hypothetical protein